MTLILINIVSVSLAIHLMGSWVRLLRKGSFWHSQFEPLFLNPSGPVPTTAAGVGVPSALASAGGDPISNVYPSLFLAATAARRLRRAWIPCRSHAHRGGGLGAERGAGQATGTAPHSPERDQARHSRISKGGHAASRKGAVKWRMNLPPGPLSRQGGRIPVSSPAPRGRDCSDATGKRLWLCRPQAPIISAPPSPRQGLRTSRRMSSISLISRSSRFSMSED